MWEKVYICTFGDDNVSSVSETVSEVFNQVTVSRMMDTTFGLTYTSDKKGAELVPYEPIEDVTFLKRSFKRDLSWKGGWVAPLAKDSFLYIPYWFRNSRDPVGDMLRNSELMLGELSLHDQALWEEYYPEIADFFQFNDLELPYNTRASARDVMSTRSDVWF
jgi:hypothetical protein